ncbi:MAG TPA: NADH-quinone oxidoreductase subunit J [Thermoanaerobaculia bacterium]|nr:NADH-quinone oxidoreductase subunit J [Thermoanaerobaculia bacterium]
MEMMGEMLSQLPSLVFFLVGTVAVASSILVVAMRNPVHSALFLLLTFLCVAVIFILAHAELVGAIQILVYAGGIMVLFLFVVMLINIRDLPDERMLSPFWKPALGVGLVLFILFASVVRTGSYATEVEDTRPLRTARVAVRSEVTKTDEGRSVRRVTMGDRAVGNSEALGMALYRDYLVPFEVASIFLLVAMIGAIVIGKRELYSMDEETNPQFITDRVAEEKRVKEASGA